MSVETNVELPGSVSTTLTFWASAGPVFVTVIMKVTSLPLTAVAGPVLSSTRLAFTGWALAATAVELLSAGGFSGVSDCTVAVLLLSCGAGYPAGGETGT